MGFYINPRDMGKEKFLRTYGKRIEEAEARAFTDFKGDALPVILVDNGAFKAAGIAYDAHERDAFLHPDRRPKTWWLVPRDRLRPYLPENL